MTPEWLRAVKYRWEDRTEPDHGCDIERVPRKPYECGVCARKLVDSLNDIPSLIKEVERLQRIEAAASNQPWIVRYLIGENDDMHACLSCGVEFEHLKPTSHGEGCRFAEIDAALDDAKGGKRSLKISVIENQNHTEHESNVHDEFARLREELNDARDERDAAREESAKLSTEVERLRGIEAAAYAYREDGYLGTDGMRHHTPEAYTDFDAALRAAGSGE